MSVSKLRNEMERMRLECDSYEKQIRAAGHIPETYLPETKGYVSDDLQTVQKEHAALSSHHHTLRAHFVAIELGRPWPPPKVEPPTSATAAEPTQQNIDRLAAELDALRGPGSASALYESAASEIRTRHHLRGFSAGKLPFVAKINVLTNALRMARAATPLPPSVPIPTAPTPPAMQTNPKLKPPADAPDENSEPRQRLSAYFQTGATAEPCAPLPAAKPEKSTAEQTPRERLAALASEDDEHDPTIK